VTVLRRARDTAAALSGGLSECLPLAAGPPPVSRRRRPLSEPECVPPVQVSAGPRGARRGRGGPRPRPPAEKCRGLAAPGPGGRLTLGLFFSERVLHAAANHVGDDSTAERCEWPREPSAHSGCTPLARTAASVSSLCPAASRGGLLLDNQDTCFQFHQFHQPLTRTRAPWRAAGLKLANPSFRMHTLHKFGNVFRAPARWPALQPVRTLAVRRMSSAAETSAKTASEAASAGRCRHSGCSSRSIWVSCEWDRVRMRASMVRF